MKNTLAYLVAELVTPVKSFIVQAPGLLIEKGSQSELISANSDQKTYFVCFDYHNDNQ